MNKITVVYLCTLLIILSVIVLSEELTDIKDVTEDVIIGYTPEYMTVENSRVVESCTNKTVEVLNVTINKTEEVISVVCKNVTEYFNTSIKIGETPIIEKSVIAYEYKSKRLDFNTKLCNKCGDLIYCLSKKDGGSRNRAEEFKCAIRSGESGYIINATEDRIIYEVSDVGVI